MFKAIWSFFTFWTKIQTKYNKLKADEEKSKTSTKLGVTSIILSIVSAVLVVGGAFGTFYFFNFMNDSSFIVGLLAFVVCLGVAIASFVQGLLGSLFYSVYQMKLNKKPIGWVSLLVWFLSLAGAVVGTLLLLGTF